MLCRMRTVQRRWPVGTRRISHTMRFRLSSSKSDPEPKSMRWQPIPITLGIAYLAYQQFQHVRERSKPTEDRDDATTDDTSAVSVPQQISQWNLLFLKTVPFRTLSRWWGHVHSEYTLPVWLRRPVYLLWTWAFDCKLEEMEKSSLEDYPNLNAFFTRRLKPGARPIDSKAAMVSPADARILHFGPVTEKSMEQVKGVSYSLDAFLGCGEHSWDPAEAYHNLPYNSPDTHQLYHCVLYLAPGDYHRFHSPVGWSIEKLKHFTGKLFSVSPGVVRMIEGLFLLNERIVMLGQWEHGFYSMTAVGATNVGSIQLAFDQSFRTNQRIRQPQGTYTEKCLRTQTVKLDPTLQPPILTRRQEKKKRLQERGGNVAEDTELAPPPPSMAEKVAGLPMQKGDEVGQFNLGSTVVLVFEAPKEFQFHVEPGQKVKVGQSLGDFVTHLGTSASITTEHQ